MGTLSCDLFSRRMCAVSLQVWRIIGALFLSFLSFSFFFFLRTDGQIEWVVIYLEICSVGPNVGIQGQDGTIGSIREIGSRRVVLRGLCLILSVCSTWFY